MWLEGGAGCSRDVPGGPIREGIGALHPGGPSRECSGSSRESSREGVIALEGRGISRRRGVALHTSRGEATGGSGWQGASGLQMGGGRRGRRHLGPGWISEGGKELEGRGRGRGKWPAGHGGRQIQRRAWCGRRLERAGEGKKTG
jgi:hypothetical protein